MDKIPPNIIWTQSITCTYVLTGAVRTGTGQPDGAVPPRPPQQTEPAGGKDHSYGQKRSRSETPESVLAEPLAPDPLEETTVYYPDTAATQDTQVPGTR